MDKNNNIQNDDPESLKKKKEAQRIKKIEIFLLKRVKQKCLELSGYIYLDGNI